jgi:hypothetical protein
MDAQQIYSPEFQFLLGCCRLKSTPIENLRRERALKGGLEESKLLELIHRHRVLPIASIFILNSPFFTDLFKSKIRNGLRQNQFDAILSTKFEKAYEDFLKEKNCFGFSFKGVSLAKNYYGDIGMRQVYDVDLYIEPSEFESAYKWLINCGYKDLIAFGDFTQLQKKYFQNAGHDLSFVNDNQNFPGLVELHWSMREGLGGFRLQPKNNLDKVDEFLYLCVHGSEHAWFRLKWIFDIIQILDLNEYDWKKVLIRAGELKCLNHLRITFLLLNGLFQIDIPTDIKFDLREARYKFHLDFIKEVISLDVSYRSNKIGQLKHLLYLLSLNNFKISRSFLLKNISSHNDWKALRIPDTLFFLYFVLRPIFLLYRGLTVLMFRNSMK